MIIDGQVFQGDNLVIINGTVVNAGIGGEKKRFDEKRKVDAKGVDRLIIDTTFIDVNIVPIASSEVEVHLSGEASVDGKLELQAELIGRSYNINVKVKGNVYNGRLRLDIQLPNKAFEIIEVQTESANINLNTGVYSKKIWLKTKTGDIRMQARFKEADSSTMSGDIRVDISAKEDIMLNTKTMSGDIAISLDNIARPNVSTRTMSGDTRNYYQSKPKGYTAQIKASSMSGDIDIR